MGDFNNYAYAPNPIGSIDPLRLNKSNNCPPTLYRTMKPENGNFQDSPSDGAPNANQKGAITVVSNPKYNHFDKITSVNDMVGPSYTGKQGLSSSLVELPIRTGQVNGTVNASTLPKGLGYENDHGKHVSIYPEKDMTFGDYQSLLNSINWK